jgi:hypothetical protein
MMLGMMIVMIRFTKPFHSQERHVMMQPFSAQSFEKSTCQQVHNVMHSVLIIVGSMELSDVIL